MQTEKAEKGQRGRLKRRIKMGKRKKKVADTEF
jgi:hypothetical protein